MSSLKKCPFCAGSASLHTQQAARWIRCHTCGAETADAVQNESAAAAAWNRRDPSPAVKALVEACRDVLKEGRPLRADIVWALAAVEREIQQ